MKTLYWKTRPLRRTADGRRRIHWPGLALNIVIALLVVAVPLCGTVLIDLEFNLAEALPLLPLALPIFVVWGVALAALGFGFRLTAPLDCLPGELGEPPASRTTRWFHWANLRAVLFGLLASLTCLALGSTVSNWRGRQAWETYQADALQRGVVLDLVALMPPRVPDAENFAATPLLLKYQSGTPEWQAFKASKEHERTPVPIQLLDPKVPKQVPPSSESWFTGQRTDLSAWQAYYRAATNWPADAAAQRPAEDVLRALARHDAPLAELRTAAARPRTWFNMHVTEDGASTLIPHINVLRTATDVVRLRTVAELASGRTNEAFADVRLMFRLGDALKDEPMLITHLVRLAMHTMALRAVWEGLADHRWTDSHLAHFQTTLAKLNFPAELRHGMAGERAFGNRIMEYLRRKPEMLPVIGQPEGGSPVQPNFAGYWVVPSGWFYREQISYHRMFDQYIMAALPTEAGKFDPALIQAKGAAMTGELHREHRPSKAILRHRILSNLLLPALEKAMHRACQAQAFTDLALTACVLERHRLVQGSYPESLSALAPEFASAVRPDPMSGKPFHYTRTADGRFRLWSVGWNGKDDGGEIVLREPGKKDVNFEQGDWIWPVPHQ